MDPHDHANMRYFTFNDLASVEAAVEEADGDVAGIVVSPFKHDAGFEQELTDPDFARGVRAICDRIGAMLIIDEVRAGFRMNHGGSWEPFGVTPDLAAWSKGIANGFALAAVTGNDAARDGAGRDLRHRVVLVPGRPDGGGDRHDHTRCATRTASPRWCGWAPSSATASTPRPRRTGVGIRTTGPVQMPDLAFEGDTEPTSGPSCSPASAPDSA